MGICSLTWGTHLQLTLMWGPHQATVGGSAPLVSSDNVALYASKQPLRFVLQIKNCPRSFVQMCLGLPSSLRLFFQSRERVTVWSKHTTWFHQLWSPTPFPNSRKKKSAQDTSHKTHYPLKKDDGPGKMETLEEVSTVLGGQVPGGLRASLLTSNQLPHCFP